MKFKHTNRTLHEVGKMLRKGLQQELIDQKHVATGKLSRGLKYTVNKNNVLNVRSSVGYWKAVNNPEFAEPTNLSVIKKWTRHKGLPLRAAAPILKKLKEEGYGQPYVFWSDGNKINRTDFAGITVRKHKDDIVNKLAPSIGVDVANMMSEIIRKNNPKTTVVEQF
tara:strand:+ start:483 stop:980 length:498 start_codon:yes stop_codon:yes gene_type:complete